MANERKDFDLDEFVDGMTYCGDFTTLTNYPASLVSGYSTQGAIICFSNLSRSRVLQIAITRLGIGTRYYSAASTPNWSEWKTVLFS